MNDFYHYPIAALLTIFLPVFLDFASLLIRLGGFSPAPNAVSQANTQITQRLISSFRDKRKVGFDIYFALSFSFAMSIMGVSVAAAAFIRPQISMDNFSLFKTLMGYAFISLLLRSYVFAVKAQRINFTKFLNDLSFSMLALLILGAGLAFGNDSAGGLISDALLLVVSQVFIYWIFRKYFDLGENVGLYTRYVSVASRLTINILLLSYVIQKFGWFGSELFALITGTAFVIELMIGVYLFEALKAGSILNRSLERYFLAALVGIVLIKVAL